MTKSTTSMVAAETITFIHIRTLGLVVRVPSSFANTYYRNLLAIVICESQRLLCVVVRLQRCI